MSNIPNTIQGGKPISDGFPDAPLSDRLCLPVDYRVERGRLFYRFADDRFADDKPPKLVSLALILIAGRLVDAKQGLVFWLLYWRVDGKWKRRTIPRERGCSAREFVPEAKYDLPVNSSNSRDMVSYLAAFEYANRNVIPTLTITQTMGWQDPKGERGFIWGRAQIRHDADGAEVKAWDMEKLSPAEWPEDAVVFHADADDGAAAIADGFHSAGTYEGWRDAVLPCCDFPIVMVGMYAALVPPLLHIVPEVDNFVVGLGGTTSSGKTTALRVLSSAWGRPDIRADGVIHTWDATAVAIERQASVLGSLPLILDDTKRANDLRVVAKVIYDISSGKGRARGSLDGIRHSGKWRTVLIMTGESPATAFTEDGGTRARVIDVFGSPFGRTDQETAVFVTALTAKLAANYGHAGPRFVARLHRTRAHWDKIRSVYKKQHQQWLERAGGNPVGARMAAYFAILTIAGHYAHTTFDLPGSATDNLIEVWNRIKKDIEIADPPKRALGQLRGWMGSHAAEFWGRHEIHPTKDGESIKVPLRGWVGAWPSDDSWSAVGFYPNRLEAALRELGHEPQSIIKAWKGRGWLRLYDDGRNPKVRVYLDRVRLVCIQREAFDALDEVK